MREGGPATRTAADASPGHNRLRDRWFSRLFRWLEGPTYANEVDAIAALYSPQGLEPRDADCAVADELN